MNLLNPINFAGIEPIDTSSGLGDMFGEYLRASKLKHEGALAKEKAGLAREKAKYVGPFEQAKLKEKEMASKIKELEFGREQKYGDLEKRSELAHKLAQINELNSRAELAGETSTQKDLKSLYGKNTPEYKSALEKVYKLKEAKEGEPGSLNNLDANARNNYYKWYHDEQVKMKDADDILTNVRKFKELNNKNPDLWKDFNQIIARNDENDINALGNILLKKYAGNEKKLSAITLGLKYANAIALRSGGQFGKNFTDAKLKLVQTTKPNPKYPKQVNDTILNNLEEEFNYVPGLRKSISKALKEGAIISLDYDDYRPKKEKAEEFGKLIKEPMEMPQQLNQFDPTDLTDENVRETARKHNISEQQVREMMGL